MKTQEAFAMGDANHRRPTMVFDWNKAARIICASNAKSASAGLRGDWGWTGGAILRNGRPIPRDMTYTYLASTWAVPELEIDGEVIECFCMEDGSGWDSGTYWPESALEIMRRGHAR